MFTLNSPENYKGHLKKKYFSFEMSLKLKLIYNIHIFSYFFLF